MIPENLVIAAQLASNVALILSLLFVVTRLVQNTKDSRARTQQEVATWYVNYAAVMLQNGALDVQAKAALTPDQLNSEDFQKYRIICRVHFMAFQSLYYQYRAGLCDPEVFFGVKKSNTDLLCQAGPRSMWKLTRVQYGDEFRTFMDQQITEAKSQSGEDPFTHWTSLVEEEMRVPSGVRSVNETAK